MRIAVVATLAVVLVAGFPPPSSEADLCPEGFETIVVPGATLQCSHPDSPPASSYRSTSFYAAAAEARSITCIGDGAEGNRLQAVYVTEGSASLSDTDRATIELGMINTTAVYESSSLALGTSLRLPRWVHDSECRPVIEVVSVPSGALDTFNATIQAVAAAGYGRADRKYIMWADSAAMCGVAAVTMDDSKQNNGNDGTHPGYARIDRGCWGYQGSVVAHEVTHTLGAVLPSAPNATQYGHCTDEYDVMCYQDGVDTSITVVCPSSTSDLLLDCNNDDYFHTQPAPGSYLHTRWNVADSSFLERIEVTEPAPAEMEFRDVPEGHPRRLDIDWLAQRGVTRGCGDALFCPDDGVTRGQLSAFLHRYAPDTETTFDPVAFTDVEPGSVFADDISWLVQTGITRGCGGSGFCPDAPVTRGQIAAFLHRLFAAESAGDLVTFYDVAADHPFYAEIGWLASQGVTNGCGDGRFCPEAPMSRAEMAAFLHRASGLLESSS